MQNTKILPIIGFGLALAALIANHAFGRLQPAQPHLLPVETLPRQLGGWTAGPDRSLDSSIRKILPTARIVDRIYTNRSGESVDLLVLSAADYKDFHDPNICFPGQGFTLSDQKTATIAGQTIDTMMAARGADKMDVYYWLAGDAVESVPQGLPLEKVLAVRNLMLKTQGQSLFVRLIAPHDAQSGAALADLTRQLLTPLRAMAAAKTR